VRVIISILSISPLRIRLFSRTFRYRKNLNLIFFGDDGKENDARLNMRYIGKGFITSGRRAREADFDDMNLNLSNLKFNAYRIDYLYKTLKLALENDVDVLTYVSPLPPTVFKTIESYKVIHSRIQQICDSLQITLLDFNLINQRTNLFVDDNFMDSIT